MPIGFIAVHVGAGYHSEEKRHGYEKVCKLACTVANKVLREDGEAVDAVCEAVRILEDSPLTNAGTGSNLTLNGKTQCDAAVMDGKTLNFGAVGALSGLKNPVLVAKQLLIQQNNGLLPLGRIPPCFLVGIGAQQWAIANNFTPVPDDEMSTAKGRETYLKYKRSLDEVMKSDKRQCLPDGNRQALDTVGAVCVDSRGNVATAVSSGGLVLKQDGRIGQAAVYGCGCWAQNLYSSSVAATTTGVGEYLMKTTFARECSEAVAFNDDPTAALRLTFVDKFLKSPFLANCKDKFAGALVLKYESQVCDLMWAHTTSSMCLGFMSVNSANCQTVLSRLSNTAQETVEMGGVVIRM